MTAGSALTRPLLGVSSVVFLLLLTCVTGFSARGPLSNRVGVRSSSGALVLRLTPEEERATLLTAYITKANEDKMKAVRAVEEIKDAEIAALKAQLKAASSISAVPETGSSLESLSRDELIRMVRSYQQMMPQYTIGKEQTSKVVPSPANGAAGTLYQKRNQRLVASAAAGKSRWGSMEIDRAVFLTERAKGQGVESGTPSQEKVVAASTASDDKYQMRNARLVAAAAAGKTRWGEMEVLRVQKLQGASGRSDGKSAIPRPQASATDDKFQMRNARVLAAANAGKSRWGELEVEKIQNLVAGSAHANGATGTSSIKPPMMAAPAMNSKFQLRNARVVAAASAGKSRWGPMEIEKAQRLVSGSVKAVDHPVANGASHPSTKAPALITLGSSINSKFQLRNARLVAAAAAGKSRWGEMEIKKAQSYVSGSVKATDHPVANGASHPSTTTPPPVTPGSSMNSNFQLRNARVAAAASSGKSRWGEMEVNRIQHSLGVTAGDKHVANGVSNTVSNSPPKMAAGVSMNPYVPLRNARVAAAGAAGKSRWGELELQRMQISGHVASAAANGSPQPAGANGKFQMRNARLVAAASAGKARWGELEVQKALQLSNGVSGYTQNASANGVRRFEVNSNFQLRNARLVQAARAGKTRWGEMEVLRAERST